MTCHRELCASLQKTRGEVGKVRLHISLRQLGPFLKNLREDRDSVERENLVAPAQESTTSSRKQEVIGDSGLDLIHRHQSPRRHCGCGHVGEHSPFFPRMDSDPPGDTYLLLFSGFSEPTTPRPLLLLLYFPVVPCPYSTQGGNPAVSSIESSRRLWDVLGGFPCFKQGRARLIKKSQAWSHRRLKPKRKAAEKVGTRDIKTTLAPCHRLRARLEIDRALRCPMFLQPMSFIDNNSETFTQVPRVARLAQNFSVLA